jgi:hypothetical protein
MKHWLADLCIVIGLSSVGIGLWEMSPSLSKVVVGGIILAMGVWGYGIPRARRP